MHNYRDRVTIKEDIHLVGQFSSFSQNHII